MGLFTRIVNGYLRQYSESSTTPIYDQSVDIGSTISSGTPYTLPVSGTYVGDELEIYFNGQTLDSGTDFTFVGSGTKTQISFTFDLISGDHLRFRTIRGA